MGYPSGKSGLRVWTGLVLVKGVGVPLPIGDLFIGAHYVGGRLQRQKTCSEQLIPSGKFWEPGIEMVKSAGLVLSIQKREKMLVLGKRDPALNAVDIFKAGVMVSQYIAIIRKSLKISIQANYRSICLHI